MTRPPASVRRTAAPVVALGTVLVAATVLLAGCADDGDVAADPAPTATSATPTAASAAPSGSASPSATPSVSPPPTPGEEFSGEVEELYALVQRSVEGSRDLSGSSRVLQAFATTVALVRVPPELTGARQRVVDAAQAAAASYGTAAGITGAVERAAATTQAVVRLRELEKAIRTLPE